MTNPTTPSKTGPAGDIPALVQRLRELSPKVADGSKSWMEIAADALEQLQADAEYWREWSAKFEAERDALRTQVATLNRENNALQGAYSSMMHQRDELRAKCERYEKALKWYATQSNWIDDFVTHIGGNKALIYRGDGGVMAREALAEDKS